MCLHQASEKESELESVLDEKVAKLQEEQEVSEKLRTRYAVLNFLSSPRPPAPPPPPHPPPPPPPPPPLRHPPRPLSCSWCSFDKLHGSGVTP